MKRKEAVRIIKEVAFERLLAVLDLMVDGDFEEAAEEAMELVVDLDALAEA